MQVVGTVITSVNVADNKWHGSARVPNDRRIVHLQGELIKKVDGDSLRKFLEGEEAQFPPPGASVLITYPPHEKKLIASKWGVL